MPRAKKKKTPQWFAYVPAEIRNNVYEQYFNSMRVSRVESTSRKGKRNHAAVRTAPLNLLLVSRRVKAEAESFFWRLTLFTYYASYSSDFPLRDQVNRIQCLWLRGPHCTWAGMLDLVLPRTIDSEATMRSLKIGQELDMHHDVGILHKLIEHSKNRVGLLSLTLDTLAFAVYANLDVSLHDPLSDEHSCKVTARNTYDIALESQHKPSIEAVTMWLKTVYDKDFQKTSSALDVRLTYDSGNLQRALQRCQMTIDLDT